MAEQQTASQPVGPDGNKDEQLCIDFKLNWTSGGQAPRKMHRAGDAVVDGNVVYFKLAMSKRVLAFDLTTSNWSPLPSCLLNQSVLAIVDHQLVTVGGVSLSRDSEGTMVVEPTDKLYTLTGEDSDKYWMLVLPCMLTKRTSVAAISLEKALIFDCSRWIWSTAQAFTICGGHEY